MSGPSAPSGDVDALFKLPLGEFTAARNALVADLKKTGRQAEANKAKALAKPSVSAWVVNQLYWRHRVSFDRLIEAGDRLRRTQALRRTSDPAREPSIARREAMTVLTEIAGKILREGNHGATRDLLRRVTSTLEAISSYGSARDAPIAGRLTDDLEPPGFEVAANLLPESDKRAAVELPLRARLPRQKPLSKPLRPKDQQGTTDRRHKKERKSLLAAARVAVREAERALNVACKQVEHAAATSDAAAKHAKAIDGQRTRIEKRLVQATKDAEDAHRHASEAAARAREAAQIAEATERALEIARQRLTQVAAGGD